MISSITHIQLSSCNGLYRPSRSASLLLCFRFASVLLPGLFSFGPFCFRFRSRAFPLRPFSFRSPFRTRFRFSAFHLSVSCRGFLFPLFRASFFCLPPFTLSSFFTAPVSSLSGFPPVFWAFANLLLPFSLRPFLSVLPPFRLLFHSFEFLFRLGFLLFRAFRLPSFPFFRTSFPACRLSSLSRLLTV